MHQQNYSTMYDGRHAVTPPMPLPSAATFSTQPSIPQFTPPQVTLAQHSPNQWPQQWPNQPLQSHHAGGLPPCSPPLPPGPRPPPLPLGPPLPQGLPPLNNTSREMRSPPPIPGGPPLPAGPPPFVQHNQLSGCGHPQISTPVAPPPQPSVMPPPLHLPPTPHAPQVPPTPHAPHMPPTPHGSHTPPTPHAPHLVPSPHGAHMPPTLHAVHMTPAFHSPHVPPNAHAMHMPHGAHAATHMPPTPQGLPHFQPPPHSPHFEPVHSAPTQNGSFEGGHWLNNGDRAGQRVDGRAGGRGRGSWQARGGRNQGRGDGSRGTQGVPSTLANNAEREKQMKENNTPEKGSEQTGKTEPVTLECKNCDRTFQEPDHYKGHMSTHLKCDHEGCTFEASGRILKEHKQEMHQEKFSTAMERRAALLRPKMSKEEIDSWRAERRKNYPTVSNVDKKKALAAARRERGELVDHEEIQKRRERMREILHIQTTMGIPVAEVPAFYTQETFTGRGRWGRGGRGGRSFRGGGRWGNHSRSQDWYDPIKEDQKTEGAVGHEEEQKGEKREREEEGAEPPSKRAALSPQEKNEAEGAGAAAAAATAVEGSRGDVEMAKEDGADVRRKVVGADVQKVLDGNKRVDDGVTGLGPSPADRSVGVMAAGEVVEKGGSIAPPGAASGAPPVEGVDGDVAREKKGQRACYYFFKNGRCKKGSNCDYLHDRTLGPRGKLRTNEDGGQWQPNSRPQRRQAPRQPSLLHKLLAPDIRLEKSHLLQSLRFIVNNNFLLDFPATPLKFLHGPEPEEPRETKLVKPEAELEEILKILENESVEEEEVNDLEMVDAGPGGPKKENGGDNNGSKKETATKACGAGLDVGPDTPSPIDEDTHRGVFGA